MMRQSRKKLAVAGLLILAMAGSPLAAQQPPPPGGQPLVDASGAIIVPLGGAVRFQPKSKKVLRAVFSDKTTIARAETDPTENLPRSVIVQGRTVGTARVELTDIDGGKEIYEVVVLPDYELLKTVVRRASAHGEHRRHSRTPGASPSSRAMSPTPTTSTASCKSRAR